MEFVGRRIACPLCGAADERHETVSATDRTGVALRTVLCPDCGLVFNNPMPTAEEVGRFYRDDYRALYKGVRQPKPKHILRAARQAKARFAEVAGDCPAGGRLLDLGAGGGEYVYLLTRHGFAAEGIEPNTGYAEYARAEYGVPIHVGGFDAFAPAAPYDMISSFHVFEHLIDPLAAFARAHAWLKPGGLLYLEVPNVDAAAQTFRSRFHFAHVFQYSPATLAAFAGRGGFRAERALIGGDSGVVRTLFRRLAAPVAAMPTAASVAKTRAVLAARARLGANWLPRTIRKYLGALAEKRAVRGLAGRAVADRVFDAVRG